MGTTWQGSGGMAVPPGVTAQNACALGRLRGFAPREVHLAVTDIDPGISGEAH
jgi:hypothetical protein